MKYFASFQSKESELSRHVSHMKPLLHSTFVPSEAAKKTTDSPLSLMTLSLLCVLSGTEPQEDFNKCECSEE